MALKTGDFVILTPDPQYQLIGVIKGVELRSSFPYGVQWTAISGRYSGTVVYSSAELTLIELSPLERIMWGLDT